MFRTCIAVAAAAVFFVGCAEPGPPDAQTLLDSARAAMGAENLTSVEFSANGWEGSFGQPWNINEGWGAWNIRDYNRVIDYANFESRQTAQRQAGRDPMKLGGGGAQPNAAPQNQQSTVTSDSGFTQKLQVWFTPYGFVRLAAESNPTITSETMNQTTYNVASFQVTEGGDTYDMRGYFNEMDLLERIETRVDNPVFGDMLVEAEFGDYRDFDGLMFPTTIVQKQGGFSTLELTVENVIPNTAASAAPPEAAGGRGGRGGGGRGGPGGAPPEPPPFTEIGDGIYVINGGYQSVAVEFDEFSVVVEGLQNPERAAQLIEITKMAIPDKPIRYVVTTHAHFDHVSGLREFVAEGATIITHEIDAPFYEAALGAPRTINPDRAEETGATPLVEGVGDTYVIEDGNQRLELYKLQGSLHADDMMIAYLPGINTVIEADLLQPWMNPAFGGGAGSGPHPFLVHLANELDRLGLDYEQFVPVHRPDPAPTVPRAALMAAVGR